MQLACTDIWQLCYRKCAIRWVKKWLRSIISRIKAKEISVLRNKINNEKKWGLREWIMRIPNKWLRFDFLLAFSYSRNKIVDVKRTGNMLLYRGTACKWRFSLLQAGGDVKSLFDVGHTCHKLLSKLEPWVNNLDYTETTQHWTATVRKTSRLDIDIATVESLIRCDQAVMVIYMASAMICMRRIVVTHHGKCTKVQECRNRTYHKYIYCWIMKH
jgi:hypothetical protein